MEESSRKAPVRGKTAKAPGAEAGKRAAAGARAVAKPAGQSAGKPAAGPKAAPRAKSAVSAPGVDREARIRTAAYLRAERRGFAPGHEFDDWIAAELEVSEQDTAATPVTPTTRSRKATSRKPPAG